MIDADGDGEPTTDPTMSDLPLSAEEEEEDFFDELDGHNAFLSMPALSCIALLNLHMKTVWISHPALMS